MKGLAALAEKSNERGFLRPSHVYGPNAVYSIIIPPSMYLCLWTSAHSYDVVLEQIFCFVHWT